jgi:hypothetical protein
MFSPAAAENITDCVASGSRLRSLYIFNDTVGFMWRPFVGPKVEVYRRLYQQMSEFLPTDPEDPGSIPGATRVSGCGTGSTQPRDDN